MRTTAEVNGVEFVSWWRILIFESVKNWMFEFGRAIFFTEIEAETFFSEVGVTTTEICHSGVFLESGFPIGIDHLDRALMLDVVVIIVLKEGSAGCVSRDGDRLVNNLSLSFWREGGGVRKGSLVQQILEFGFFRPICQFTFGFINHGLVFEPVCFLASPNVNIDDSHMNVTAHQSHDNLRILWSFVGSRGKFACRCH